MGIINITPDSFYEPSRILRMDDFIKKAEEMISEGVNIIDIGAYSTRPGAGYVTENEELIRIEPYLKAINKTFPECIISIDTYRSKIAQIAVQQYNVKIINDISAGSFDKTMFEVIGKLNIPFVIMHNAGSLENMHHKVKYNNLITDIIKYFAEKTEIANSFGISDIIIDPGFGFSKSMEDNYNLLSNLDKLKIFQLPVLAGLSRKSMLFKLLDISQNDALNATVVANTVALLKGADILRVHDVKEAVEAIKIVKQILKDN
jgi:dihydropteroate synthase